MRGRNAWKIRSGRARSGAARGPDGRGLAAARFATLGRSAGIVERVDPRIGWPVMSVPPEAERGRATVTISAGSLRGVALADGVHRWLGIPYAAAPVGQSRFERPVAHPGGGGGGAARPQGPPPPPGAVTGPPGGNRPPGGL
ncbi:carboxylesterase family protein, partial [Embleya sp. NPDC056538]|uniref:carboxylesterase family protein n=1 Tax=Embleya sp. NPDC056538 TaxID=3345858 RepID=UPI003694E49A